jgi:hypothetical protein
MPISNRRMISQNTSPTKNWAIEHAMIAARSMVNSTWRPNISVSQPPRKAPRKMPTNADAPTNPSSADDIPNLGLICTRATPMMDST